MVQQRLQQNAEAQTALNAARNNVNAHWPPKKGNNDGWWTDWFVAHLLLKEAETLIGTAGPRP